MMAYAGLREFDSQSMLWRNWKGQLEDTFTVVEAASGRLMDPASKLALLRLKGGQRICTVLENSPPLNEEGVGLSVSLIANDEYRLALSSLDDFFEGEENPQQERGVFRQMKQEEGENSKTFVVRLRAQAMRCRFLDVEDQISEQFTNGCTDPVVRDKLLEGSNSLEAVLRFATKRELMGKTKAVAKRPFIEPSEVNRVASAPAPKKRNVGACFFCAEPGHFSRDCERRKKSICKVCNKRGHDERSCWALNRPGGSSHEARFGREARPLAGKETRIRNVSEHERECEYLFFVEGEERMTVAIGGVDVDVLIDSGCTSNVIPEKYWTMMKVKGVKAYQQSTDVERTFKAFGSEKPLDTIGSFEADVRAGRTEVRARFYVLGAGEVPLIGSRTAKELGVLQVGLDKVNV